MCKKGTEGNRKQTSKQSKEYTYVQVPVSTGKEKRRKL